jgi:hypothetical protein
MEEKILSLKNQVEDLAMQLDESRKKLTTAYCKNQTSDTEIKDKYTNCCNT